MFSAYTTWAIGHDDLAETTVKLYVNRLQVIARECGDLLSLTTDMLDRFFEAHRSLAAETRKTFRSAVRSFYRWAVRSGLVASSPVTDDMKVRVIVAPPRIADDESVQLGLIGAPDDETLMILLARLGCLRVSEIAHLHTDAVEGRLLRFAGKGSRVRIVPLEDEQLFRAIMTVLRSRRGEHFFPGRNGGPASSDHVYRVIVRRTGYNPHALRHAGATAIWEATGDIEALRRFLGHASLATTMRYVHGGLVRVKIAASAAGFRSTVRSPHFPDHHRTAIGWRESLTA